MIAFQLHVRFPFGNKLAFNSNATSVLKTGNRFLSYVWHSSCTFCGGRNAVWTSTQNADCAPKPQKLKSSLDFLMPRRIALLQNPVIAMMQNARAHLSRATTTGHCHNSTICAPVKERDLGSLNLQILYLLWSTHMANGCKNTKAPSFPIVRRMIITNTMQQHSIVCFPDVMDFDSWLPAFIATGGYTLPISGWETITSNLSK